MKIGILALQGAVAPHVEKLARLHADAVEVRTPDELEELQGIILPGGESSTMIHLLKLNQLWDPLQSFLAQKPGWGLCAGAILMAKRVTSPPQQSLGLVDIDIARNAYGRQVNSFIDNLSATAESPELGPEPIEGVFIRAPRITAVRKPARVLLNWKGEPVMVRQNHWLAATFHPELTESTRLHEYFLETCRRRTHG